MTKTEVLTWKIGGVAGAGQQVAGLIFAKACSRGGLFTFDSSEYPSRIRGGLVTYRLSVSNKPVTAIYQSTQLLIALTQEAFDYCQPDVVSGGVILYDSDTFKPGRKGFDGIKAYPLPLKKLGDEAGIPPLAANMLAIGATVALLKYDLAIVRQTIAEVFRDKGSEVVVMNQKAVQAGFDYARKNLEPGKFPFTLSPVKNRPADKILVTASDMVALGAISAGCKFLASYPMTPASPILHDLINWAEKSGMFVIQPEDEISAIHMAIGAAYAGVRSMTATSGGGFALMTEGLALAAMTETPLVIVEGQRPGPATGLPTWTAQGDLAYLTKAGHGEFIRVILAPGDAAEAYELTGQAFNLAEKYQIPVFILLDKYILEGHQSIAVPANNFKIERGEILTGKDLAGIKEYKRYLNTKTGVSPRAIPGCRGGIHLANSDEHDEFGYSIEGFSAKVVAEQAEKRFRKLSRLLAELPKPKLFGPKKARLTLLGWGSTKGPVLEAMKELPQVNYLHITAPWPMSESTMKKALQGQRRIVAIENNFTGQFAEILRGQTGIKVTDRISKYNGAQFYPDEIVAQVKRLITSKG
ncbi:MAG: 2-oxoacid:acceptor oxidoreductase subunit alpha [Patescibacteria group bacterium]|nr:2-oxoacid:acceptor oxidoreductase subunit alpha [Patescibacteria group bacterium]